MIGLGVGLARKKGSGSAPAKTSIDLRVDGVGFGNGAMAFTRASQAWDPFTNVVVANNVARTRTFLGRQAIYMEPGRNNLVTTPGDITGPEFTVVGGTRTANGGGGGYYGDTTADSFSGVAGDKLRVRVAVTGIARRAISFAHKVLSGAPAPTIHAFNEAGQSEFPGGVAQSLGSTASWQLHKNAAGSDDTHLIYEIALTGTGSLALDWFQIEGDTGSGGSEFATTRIPGTQRNGEVFQSNHVPFNDTSDRVHEVLYKPLGYQHDASLIRRSNTGNEQIRVFTANNKFGAALSKSGGGEEFLEYGAGPQVESGRWTVLHLKETSTGASFLVNGVVLATNALVTPLASILGPFYGSNGTAGEFSYGLFTGANNLSVAECQARAASLKTAILAAGELVHTGW